jgi:hypothetical protein
MRSLTLVAALAGGLLSPALACAQTAVGITRDNRLVSFNPATPGTLLTDNAISGLGAGETALGIDVRPATGEIFVFGSSNRMYSVSITGAATLVGTGFTALGTTLSSFDFNPTVDRVRLVDALGGNRRLNPLTGGDAATDTALTYAAGGTPRATGVAYTNAQFGANVAMGSIREYILDSALNTLGEVGSQAGGNTSFNGGVVTPVGPLGIDLFDDAGFDIYGPTGIAYISNLGSSGSASFYTLNLTTGAASLVGTIGSGNRLVTDIAVLPAPGAAGLAAASLLALARRRRP